MEPTDPTLTAALHERILGWYDVAARDLPWRRPEATPWGVLVSEVMLQQTPVARVLPVWESWLTTWREPGRARRCVPGDGSATRGGPCGCTPPRWPSSNGTRARCLTTTRRCGR